MDSFRYGINWDELLMNKVFIIISILSWSLSQANCLTWVAPSELAQGYDERLEWELQAFDLLDLQTQPCKHQLKVELKPILSKWFVVYQLDSNQSLRKEYGTLDEFSTQLAKDLNQILGCYQSKNLMKNSNRYGSNRWKLMRPNKWPLFEVSIVSESRKIGSNYQNLSGIDFAITRPIGPWQTELVVGTTFNPNTRIKEEPLVKWSNSLGLGLSYDFWNSALHSPFLSAGLDLKGFWIQTPSDWKGSQFNVLPDLHTGIGWRGFRAHTINLAAQASIHLPLGQLEFLDTQTRKLHTYYPLAFGFKLQAGF